MGGIEEGAMVVVQRVEEAVDGGFLGCGAHCREGLLLTAFCLQCHVL